VSAVGLNRDPGGAGWRRGAGSIGAEVRRRLLRRLSVRAPDAEGPGNKFNALAGGMLEYRGAVIRAAPSRREPAPPRTTPKYTTPQNRLFAPDRDFLLQGLNGGRR
jgi:hypothetical protein